MPLETFTGVCAWGALLAITSLGRMPSTNGRRSPSEDGSRLRGETPILLSSRTASPCIRNHPRIPRVAWTWHKCRPCSEAGGDW